MDGEKGPSCLSSEPNDYVTVCLLRQVPVPESSQHLSRRGTSRALRLINSDKKPSIRPEKRRNPSARTSLLLMLRSGIDNSTLVLQVRPLMLNRFA